MLKHLRKKQIVGGVALGRWYRNCRIACSAASPNRKPASRSTRWSWALEGCDERPERWWGCGIGVEER